MSRFLILFLLLLPFSSYTQSSSTTTAVDDLIDWYDIDYQFLSELVVEKVNKLRKKKRRGPLYADRELFLAAEMHNKWQVKKGKMQHKEPKSDVSTAFKRVAKVASGWQIVGENLLILDYGFYENADGTISRDLTYEEVASKMVMLWKNSKGHYKNLIHEDYLKCGTAIQFDFKKRRIYCTQVYGAKQL